MEGRGATVEAAAMRNPQVTLTEAVDMTGLPSSPGADWRRFTSGVFDSSRPASQSAPDFDVEQSFEVSPLRTMSSAPAIDPTLGDTPRKAAVEESESEPDISDKSDSETPEPPGKSSSLVSTASDTPATEEPSTPRNAVAEPAIGDCFPSMPAVKAAFLAWGMSQKQPFTMGGANINSDSTVRLNEVGCECQGPVKIRGGGCTFRVRFRREVDGSYQLTKIFSPNWTHGYRSTFPAAPEGHVIVAKKVPKAAKKLPAIEKPQTRSKSVAGPSTKPGLIPSKSPAKRKQQLSVSKRSKKLTKAVASAGAIVIGDDESGKPEIIVSNQHNSTAPAVGQLFRRPQAFLDSKNIWSTGLPGNQSFIFCYRTRDGKLPERIKDQEKVEIGCPATVAGTFCECIVVAEQTEYEGELCWEIKKARLDHSDQCPHKGHAALNSRSPDASTSKQHTEAVCGASLSKRKHPGFVIDVSQRKRPPGTTAQGEAKRQRTATLVAKRAAAVVVSVKGKELEVDEMLYWLRKRLVDLADYDELEKLAQYLVADGLTRDCMRFVSTTDFSMLLSSRFGVEEPVTANLVGYRLGSLGLLEDTKDEHTVHNVQAACEVGSLRLALTALHPLLGSTRIVEALTSVKLTSTHLTKATEGIGKAIGKSLKEQNADVLTPFEMILLQSRLTAYTQAMQDASA